MRCVAVIGAKGKGKTTLIAAMIKRLNRPGGNYILDVNQEYTRKFGISNNYRGLMLHDDFIDHIQKCSPMPPMVSNRCIVYEDATMYFGTKDDDKRFIRQLSLSRHTNDTVIMVFHAISSIPVKMFSLIDYFVLFKTYEVPSALDAKFRKNQRMMDFRDQVMKNSDDHFHVMFKNLG